MSIVCPPFKVLWPNFLNSKFYNTMMPIKKEDWSSKIEVAIKISVQLLNGMQCDCQGQLVTSTSQLMMQRKCRSKGMLAGLPALRTKQASAICWFDCTERMLVALPLLFQRARHKMLAWNKCVTAQIYGGFKRTTFFCTDAQDVAFQLRPCIWNLWGNLLFFMGIYLLSFFVTLFWPPWC